ncbi:DegT/DnrJ/EryC1/StrS family aminotransferase [Streptomyces sp. NPDC014735]|uniref:DegT/DnrJ/EryC1/StrS family aminotransferase n=1 Tax=unclassified Streptomyces TaxID=2593676 RepID=UPI0036F82210
MINVSQPSLGEEELEAIREVFDGNWLGYGPRCEEFEKSFAQHLALDPRHLVFINSATSGLFLAAELLGLGPGDEVVMPSAAFVANANAVAATGARPVFCDVDPRTLNPTAADIERVLTPRTKAVMVLHYGGLPGDIAAIAELCRARGIPLVEDAACSIASSVDGRMCGTFGDFTVWSLDSRKIITTGDGGMIYVRDPDLARKAHRLAYHGLADRSAFTTAAQGADRWWGLDVEHLGRRLIGNDMTAAIGQVQLRRLAGFVARRSALTEVYDTGLAGLDGVRLPPRPPAGHRSTHYFYWVQFAEDIRDRVAKTLLERGIYTTFRYMPLHHAPLYRYGGPPPVLPGTDEAWSTTLLLPLHQALREDEVHTVVREFTAAVRECRAAGDPPAQG